MCAGSGSAASPSLYDSEYQNDPLWPRLFQNATAVAQRNSTANATSHASGWLQIETTPRYRKLCVSESSRRTVLADLPSASPACGSWPARWPTESWRWSPRQPPARHCAAWVRWPLTNISRNVLLAFRGGCAYSYFE